MEDIMGLKQCTLAKEISCTGIGLHTGKKVRLTIRPASVNTGIIFIRKDIPGNPAISVRPDNIFDTNRATNVSNNGYKVHTIEHLMAAFYGLGIDNAIVELDAPEVPAMDGSAAPFVFMLQQDAGIREQDAFKRFIVINQKSKPPN
jgi:UDP-3-O-[3-hydroxymyristoyl] N-acetylglucosamine deacetylase